MEIQEHELIPYPHEGGCEVCRTWGYCNYCGVELEARWDRRNRVLARCTNGRCVMCHQDICSSPPEHGYWRKGHVPPKFRIGRFILESTSRGTFQEWVPTYDSPPKRTHRPRFSSVGYRDDGKIFRDLEAAVAEWEKMRPQVKGDFYVFELGRGRIVHPPVSQAHR